MYKSRQYLSIDHRFATPTLTPITPKPVYRQHIHLLKSRVGGAFQSRFSVVECLDYQIPFSQLKGPKGNGDFQARLTCATYP